MADRKTGLGIGRNADDELRAKVVSPRVPEELADQIGALEKAGKEVDWQIRKNG